MDVLYILTNFPGYGGIEKVTLYLSEYFLNHGIRVSVIAYGTNAPQLLNSLPQDLKIWALPDSNDYGSNKNTDYIRKLLSDNCFDYIILQDSYAPIEHIFDEIEFDWGTKLIVVEHNTPLFALKVVNSYFHYGLGLSFMLSRIIKYPISIIKAYYKTFRRHQYLLNKCFRYVLLSERFKNELKAIGGNNYSDKVISITNPLTIKGAIEVRCPYEKKKQILFVGRLTQQKGVGFLLRIWKDFSKYNTDNWELVILGAGEEKDATLKYIKREGLRNVRMEPPTSEIYRYYKESSILIMTSIYEGFGLVLTEAMSCGCVPIAFDSYSAIYDIINDGENGVLVEPFNTKLFRRKLLNLTKDCDFRNILAKNAIKSIEKFSIETVGNKWLQLLNPSK